MVSIIFLVNSILIESTATRIEGRIVCLLLLFTIFLPYLVSSLFIIKHHIFISYFSFYTQQLDCPLNTYLSIICLDSSDSVSQFRYGIVYCLCRDDSTNLLFLVPVLIFAIDNVGVIAFWAVSFQRVAIT
jgi:hypothetical protein